MIFRTSYSYAADFTFSRPCFGFGILQFSIRIEPPATQRKRCSNALGLQDMVLRETLLVGTRHEGKVPALHLGIWEPIAQDYGLLGNNNPLWQYHCVSAFPSKGFSTHIIPSSLLQECA